MKKKLFSLFVFVFMGLTIFSQTELIVPGYIRLPKDSIIKTNIIRDLNGFLKACEKENSENTYVYYPEKIETFMLLDEFKNISKSRKDDNFFKPYLNNIIELDENDYLIQMSHIGTKDSISYLRTAYNLIAHKNGDSFKFSSMLKYNTKNWKSKTLGNFTFYYQDSFDEQKAKKYADLATEFDEKLNSINKKTIVYFTENRFDLLKLFGVDYRLDYNGRATGVFSTVNGKEQLIITGKNSDTEYFDTHDLWHDRLSLVKSRRLVNKHVDEGCAYLYGGSWGYSWDEIFDKFMDKVAKDKQSDWMYYKENKKNFGESQAKHLIVDYVVNALLIKKIEDEVGFKGVWELLNCGVFEKGNENYYKALEKIIGISKANYNKEVWKLINAKAAE